MKDTQNYQSNFLNINKETKVCLKDTISSNLDNTIIAIAKVRLFLLLLLLLLFVKLDNRLGIKY